ncbi:hypothetical protein ABT234_13560 [Streptomyces sp. NPDC001586]|uniref:hypothetical protein n=1 Tax=unclassified Streptomyces TaxID=2593676 RepID=UPI003329E6A8
MAPVIPRTEDDDGIPFEREELVQAREEMVQALVDLRALIADAPDDGGGPGWDKQSALARLDQVQGLPNR